MTSPSNNLLKLLRKREFCLLVLIGATVALATFQALGVAIALDESRNQRIGTQSERSLYGPDP